MCVVSGGDGAVAATANDSLGHFACYGRVLACDTRIPDRAVGHPCARGFHNFVNKNARRGQVEKTEPVFTHNKATDKCNEGGPVDQPH